MLAGWLGRLMRRLPIMVLLAAVGLPGGAAAADGVTVRTGEHAGFTRVVFTLPEGSDFSFDRHGDAIRLKFAGAGAVPGSDDIGRLQSIAGGVDGATLIPVPGKICRVSLAGNRVIVDILDDPPAPHARALKPPASAPSAKAGTSARAARPAKPAKPGKPPATPKPAAPPPAIVLAPTAPAAKPAPPQAGGAATSAVPQPVLATPLPAPQSAAPTAVPPRNSLPIGGLPDDGAPPAPPAAPPPTESSFAAALLPPDADWPSGAVLLPFNADVGAAAYRRGGEGHVVFDTAQPTDLGALRNDPVYGGAAVSLLPAGTILHLPLTAATQLRLARGADGWRVGVVPRQQEGRAIIANAAAGTLTMAAQSPGRVVAIGDPATGGLLLAGTQRATGQAWPVLYGSPEFALLPTWQGIVVDPVSDRAVLAVTKAGFALSASPPPALAMPPMQQTGPEIANSIGMTRRFDLASLPEPLLRNRLHQAEADAAAAPKLGRFPPRLRAAQAMISLGLGVEAAALLRAAEADDPQAAGDPAVAGLAAVADQLAGRSTQADRDSIDDPRLTGSDEIALWRGLLHGDDQDPAAAAAAVASGWKLVLAYPAPLQRRLLPEIAAILARGGQTAALRALLDTVPDAHLDAAKAALLQANGKTDAALAVLDGLADSADRQASSQARRARTELLLASHRIDGNAAAAQLRQQLFAWRGGPQDFALRMRLAALYGQNGDWRAALALLRATDPLYPEMHDRLSAAEHADVAELIRGLSTDHMTPLDVVTVAEECATLLAETDGDAKLAPVLADKLMALDLPERAEPVLQHILDHAGSPAAKAAVGLRLAELRLDLHGTKAALATLDASDAADLPAPLIADRTFARARAVAAGGDRAAALRLLGGVDTEAALELRGKLEEEEHDWPAAETTAALLALKTLPASGPLDATQQTALVHLAALASQAGDMAALHHLQIDEGSRISAGPRADLFKLLTESPVAAVADLPRSERELTAARTVPAGLASLRDH